MSVELHNAERPVVVFGNGIGDHLLNLPALRALAHLFPEKLLLVCRHGAVATFFSDLVVRAVHETTFERLNAHREFDADAVAGAIGECDLLLSLNPWHSPSVDRLLAHFVSVESVGFFPGFRSVLPLDFTKHATDLAFDVVRRVAPTLQVEDFAGPPCLPIECDHSAERLRRVLPASFRVLAVHPDTQEDKMWPAGNWVLLLDEFLERHRHFVVFVVGARDIGLERGRWRERVLPCYGLPLAGAISLVGKADLFLGVDSCMLHAADLFRVPGVGLFGPTMASEFGFRLGPHRHVCGEGTTASISVSEVAAALESLLSEGDDAGVQS